jgi:shikimate dehydrogenase
MGAANTLWFEDGRLMADNTDAIGFIEHLRISAPGLSLRGKVISLLGAGGAARALVHAFLLYAGAAEIRIFNRTRDRAEVIRRRYGAHSPIKPYDWRDRVDGSREAALLVNATSLGMKGAGGLEMDVSRLDAKCVVADIVYVPLETPLLASARARGLATVDGLGMLLHQATPGFEKWFGVKPEVTDELRALVVADIEGR